MKKITAFLLYLLIPYVSFSAETIPNDSTTFVEQTWKTKEITKGILWKTAAFENIFNSKQNINIIEIDLKRHLKSLKIKALSAERQLTSSLAKNVNASIAINGGFFDMTNGGAVDFIKVDNNVINTTRAKTARANGFFAFDKRSLKISSDSLAVATYPNVLLSGPILIEDHQVITLTKNAFNDNRHPRTAIGLKDNKLIMFTVDGRFSQSQGLTLHELTKVMKWYGCSTVLNLDGGGSTTMYIHNQPDSGVVNYPCDNKIFDHQGERKVSNIIYITK